MQNSLPYRYLLPEGKQLAIAVGDAHARLLLFCTTSPSCRHDQNAHWFIRLTSTFTLAVAVASRCLLIFGRASFQALTITA